MIGNDIVDLALARKESNWQRKGFLDKIFTKKEQLQIVTAQNPETMVWNLWSRKEAAYKIYNRETKISGYFPTKLVCFYESLSSGTVSINNRLYYTQSIITTDYINTVAVTQKENLNRISVLDIKTKIHKKHGIPYIIDSNTKSFIPVSVSHHGRFIESVRVMP